jgi:spoIIIJ-associated protein
MDRASIQAFVEELLAALGVTVEAVAVSDGARIVVSVTTPDRQLLIGEKGETLRALNHLARRIAEARFKEKEAAFTIDVGGYLESQLDSIRANARMLAQRARLFKHEVEMPPMSSYERLVVHELFAEDPEIETQSAGEGKFRHVVLKYVEKGLAA